MSKKPMKDRKDFIVLRCCDLNVIFALLSLGNEKSIDAMAIIIGICSALSSIPPGCA